MTRLPRELELPDERRWEQGTPKTVLEPLLDFWYISSFLCTPPSQTLTSKQARRLRLARRGIALQLDSPSIPNHHHHTLRYLSWNNHTIPTHTLRTQAIQASQRHPIASLSHMAVVVHRGPTRHRRPDRSTLSARSYEQCTTGFPCCGAEYTGVWV